MLRIGLVRPERVQMFPQQNSSVNSWNTLSNRCGGSDAALVCDAPSTSWRILAPAILRADGWSPCIGTSQTPDEPFVRLYDRPHHGSPALACQYDRMTNLHNSPSQVITGTV